MQVVLMNTFLFQQHLVALNNFRCNKIKFCLIPESAIFFDTLTSNLSQVYVPDLFAILYRPTFTLLAKRLFLVFIV